MRVLVLLTLLAFTSQLSLDPAAAQPNEESPAKDSSSTVVDLNRASAAELTRLPGIGPSLAERIVSYRTKRPFQTKRDLRRVKGIGFQKYTRIAPLVTVEVRAQGKRTKRKRSKVQK